MGAEAYEGPEAVTLLEPSGQFIADGLYCVHVLFIVPTGLTIIVRGVRSFGGKNSWEIGVVVVPDQLDLCVQEMILYIQLHYHYHRLELYIYR